MAPAAFSAKRTSFSASVRALSRSARREAASNAVHTAIIRMLSSTSPSQTSRLGRTRPLTPSELAGVVSTSSGTDDKEVSAEEVERCHLKSTLETRPHRSGMSTPTGSTGQTRQRSTNTAAGIRCPRVRHEHTELSSSCCREEGPRKPSGEPMYEARSRMASGAPSSCSWTTSRMSSRSHRAMRRFLLLVHWVFIGHLGQSDDQYLCRTLPASTALNR